MTKASVDHGGAEKIQGQPVSFSFTVLYMNMTSDQNRLYTEKSSVLI